MADAKTKSTSVSVLMVGVLASSIAVAAGAGGAWLMRHSVGKVPDAVEMANASQDLPKGMRTVALPSIITNLSGDKALGVRLDLVVLVDAGAGKADILAPTLASDIAAYVRTLSQAQIEGPVNFLALREDLGEIARARTKGHSHGVLIHSLMVE